MRSIKARNLAAMTTAALLLFACLQPATAETLHWTFDGDLEEDGGVLNGTAVGDAYAGTDNGVSGGAAVFDGLTDAISIDSSALGAGSFTITFWAKDGEIPSGKYNYMVSDSLNPTSILAFYAYRTSSTQVKKNGGYCMGSQFVSFENSLSETWSHYALRLDNDAHIYRVHINGSWRASKTSIPSFTGIDSASDLYLGNNNALDRDYNGMIDDLQIYDYYVSDDDLDWLIDNPGETLSEIPEPTTLVMLAGMVLGIFMLRRRS